MIQVQVTFVKYIIYSWGVGGGGRRHEWGLCEVFMDFSRYPDANWEILVSNKIKT